MATAACPRGPDARHNPVYPAPPAEWAEGLPLGNGRLGAMVWGRGPLLFSLDRGDLWDLTPVAEFRRPDYGLAELLALDAAGRHGEAERLYEAPYSRPAPTKIPAGRLALACDGGELGLTTLDLARAEASVAFGPHRLSAVVLATRPAGVVHGTGPAPGVRLRAPRFSGPPPAGPIPDFDMGPLTRLGYPAARAAGGPGWAAFTQAVADSLVYAVAAAWRDDRDGWTLAWSIARVEDRGDTAAAAALDEALGTATEVVATGHDSLLAEHRAWWEAYWAKSAVALPDAGLERSWYLDQYKFGAAGRRGAPPISLQGVWTCDNDRLPPWKSDFHHDLNTQESYWPAYSANHLEEEAGFLDWLWETRDAARDWTRRFYGLPGLAVPGACDLLGRPLGGWRQYGHSATTGAWLAHHFYLHWRYSADRAFLAERAYPYLSEAADFLEAFTAALDGSGRRTFPISASPEIHDNTPAAWFTQPTNYDVALTRWLMAATAELADAVGDAAGAARRRAVLAQLPGLALDDDGGWALAPGYPLEESHRHFSHLMALHPLGLAADPAVVAASLDRLDRLGHAGWGAISYGWLACLRARAGRGQAAYEALDIFNRAFVLPNGLNSNGDQTGQGHSAYSGRTVTLDANFAAAAGLQEMLLQSHRGRIEVFPAVPAAWRDAAFTTFRAEGGYLVSARREGGETVLVEIGTETGGTCRVASPDGGPDLVKHLEPGATWRAVG